MSNIEMRSCYEYNNDPQRRCYNGCHFSTARGWTEWEVVEYAVQDVPDRLKFWKELNEYAVSQRGVSATREFREVE